MNAEARPPASVPRVCVDGLSFHAVTVQQAVDRIVAGARSGIGGWVATPNTDIMRLVAGDPDLRALVQSADLVLADGMPVVWASRLTGRALPERVPGSTVVERLVTACAHTGLRVFLLGGLPGVPERAKEELQRRGPSLQVVGAVSPELGLDPVGPSARLLAKAVADSGADLVLVGLGFPKQELLIRELRQAHPSAWYVGCGITLAFLAGDVQRAPDWAQRTGLEWAHRLSQEPRRLSGRYLRRDIPFALGMLARALRDRDRGRHSAS